MPKIKFKNKEMSCQEGDMLRDVLLRNKLSPHNGNAQWLNCRGLGTCGTCAVEISGLVSEPTKVEKWRLNFPPHNSKSGLRLACQCHVLGDIIVTKHNGFWGEKVDGD